MRTLFRTFLFLLITAPAALAQVYTMDNTPVSTCTGTFTDFGGTANNYGSNQNFTKTISSSNGERIQVNFSSFNTEYGFDYLYIYDGADANAPLLASLTGQYANGPGVFTSAGQALTFRFVSDNGTTASGWVASLSCAGPLPTFYALTTGAATVTTCNAIVTDDGGYTGDYGTPDQDVSRTFCSSNGQHLQADLLRNGLSLLYGDTLFVYDGASTSARRLAAYTQASAFENIISSGTCLTFRFKTSPAGSSSGFAVQLSCTATAPSTSPTFVMSTGIRTVCSGTFYDAGGLSGNYPSGASQVQTFVTPNNERLTITFAGFSTEAGLDRLYVYDGPSANAPLIGVYSGSATPAPITSTGNALTFYFYSDNSTTSGGWGASFSCSGTALTQYSMTPGTVTACSGVSYDAGGPQNVYPDNANTTQTFCSGTSDKLKFTFNNQAFNLFMGDTLKIYDGNTSSSQPIGYYTEGSMVEDFTSTGNCVTFKFNSDAANHNDGWQAAFACTTASITGQTYAMSPGRRFVDCATPVLDPGGTGNYGNYLNTTEIFTSKTGERLKLDFSSFCTESSLDYLLVFDGTTSNHPLLGRFTGSSLPASLTSSGSSLTLVFISDGSTTCSGFQAAFSCAGPVLTPYSMNSGTATACTGVFYDAGGPGTVYPAGDSRTQTFCSGSSGQHLRFHFNRQAFKLNNQDTLFVFDGSSVSAIPIGTYTQGSIVEDFQSTGTCLTFRFKSNASSQNDGWQGIFTCTDQPLDAQPIALSSGTRWVCNTLVRDPGGLGNYSSSSSYTTQTYHSSTSSRLRLTFTQFSTEAGLDRLYVYDGPTTNYPLLGIFSGSAVPAALESSGAALTLEFITDNGTSLSGYEANLACFGSPLAVHSFEQANVIACEGIVSDPGGPGGGYLPNQDKVQTFCSGSGQIVGLTFNNLATGFAAGDTLYVYDGSGTNAPMKAKYYNGTTALDAQYSSGTCLTLRFRTDGSQIAAGFQGFIRCVDTEPLPRAFTMNTATIVTCSGSFTDPGGPSGNYSSSSSYNQQTFRAESGYKMAVRFNSFSTEAGLDRLYVYDGPSTSSPLLGTWSGTNSPGTITSTGSSLTFEFLTDNGGTSSGWQADLACVANVPLAGQVSGGPFCAGSTINIPYTSPAVQAGNTYSVQLSDANGLFSTPITIGTASSVATFGGISATLPATLAAGAGYRLRVMASAPAMAGNVSNFTLTVLAAPQQPPSISGPTSFCPNATGIQYSTPSIAGATGYVWSVPQGASITAGQNTSTITVNMSSQGGNVTVFSTNGCGNSAERALSVAPGTAITPTVSISSNATGNQFCPGTQVQFTSSTNVTSATYQWKKNSADIPGATQSSYTATPQSGEVYSLVIFPSGCYTATSAISNNITLQAAPTVRPQVSIDGASTRSLCQGAQLTLDLTVSGQGSTPTYRWYKNNTLLATQSTPSLQTTNVTNGDRFQVILQSSSACASPTSDTSQTVTVNVTPSVQPSVTLSTTATGTVCNGQTITLKARFANGGASPSFSWTVNAVLQSSTDSVITVAATAPTLTAQVTVTSNAACASPSSVVSTLLVVNSVPQPTVSFTQVMDTLVATATGAATYQWYLNSNSIPGATLPKYRPTISGLYKVEAFSPDSACSATAPEMMVVITAGKAMLSVPRRFYPNPARDALYLEGLPVSDLRLTCSSATGSRYTVPFVWVDGKIRADVSDLARGLYTLEVQAGGPTYRLKWVKE